MRVVLTHQARFCRNPKDAMSVRLRPQLSDVFAIEVHGIDPLDRDDAPTA